MAEVSRPDYTYQWSSGGSIVAPSNAKIQTGWTAEVPPFQWENWSQNRQDNAIVHLFQKGISTWSATQDYYFTTNGTRAYVQGSDGTVYVSTQNSTNQNPVADTSHTYWKPAFAENAGHGRCRLAVSSTTTLTLSPYNGNGVIVNGVTVVLPSAGVTYTASGLAASTVYYVYLTGNTANPVVALSTTGYTTNTNGIVVKSGDPTQTLVGMVRTNASTQFVDSLASRTCLNWFNRRNLPCANLSTSPFTFTSLAYVEASTTLRLIFLTWADDGVDISSSGYFTSSALSIIGTQLYLDGAQAGPVQQTTIQSNAQSADFSSRAANFYTEGVHTASLFVSVSNGATGTLQTVQTNAVVRG